MTNPKNIKKNEGLDFNILNYMNQHRDTPFNGRVMMWVLKDYDYSQRYMAYQLSRLEKKGYLNEVDKGIYIFTKVNFNKIKQLNPELAKQISVKEKSK